MKLSFTPTEGPLAGILMDKFASPNPTVNPRSKEGFDPEKIIALDSMVFTTYVNRQKVSGRYKISRDGDNFIATYIPSEDDRFLPVIPDVPRED